MAIGDGVSALASLAVTFGGFSPTAMDGVQASREQIERVEREQAIKKAQRKRELELERARTSKPHTYVDDESTTWTYVVIDEEVVRVTSCNSCLTTIHIPCSIEEKPVVAIGPEACARMDGVQEIICPDSVEFIGACAFRFCANLRRIVFPINLGEFSSSWLQHCPRLEEIVLPGRLDVITSAVLDNRGLKSLVIGAHVNAVEPGAFQETQLESVKVDPDNPFIKTDGDALYTADGRGFIALMRPIESYAVADRCEYLSKKAFSGISALKKVVLPSTLRVIGPYSFAHSGLQTICVPSSTTEICEKAFLHCKELRSIELNEGLTSIGEMAFAESALESLAMPSSIRNIGASMTVRSKVVHAGPECSISIDPKCPELFLDGEGGLYKKQADGPHLLQLIDREAISYRVLDGTVEIDDYAFAYHDAIEDVIVPEGVLAIGRNAFRICTKLRSVELPDSVREIGAEAFLDTRLESFRVPRDLETLGGNALITYGAHHGDKMPSLENVQVAPGNEHFFVKDGMLCGRTASGSNIIVFTSSCAHVEFPEDAFRIEEYAFNNARGIDYLGINARLQTIGTSGLTTWCWIRHIHVELGEPLKGRTSYDFFFPNTPKGIHGISTGIGGSSWVNVPGIMAQYDMCIANARDYNAPRNPDNISAYEQAKLVLGRLDDPIMLTNVNKGMFERLLRLYTTEICVDIARHDDRAMMDALVNRGFVNATNIDEIIERVTALQDAAMTAYLLELKRLRFARNVYDYDL